MGTQGQGKCRRCGRRANRGRADCHRCRRRPCTICKAEDPAATGSTCPACALAVRQIHAAHALECGPAHPELARRLARFAELAALGLPLFGAAEGGG